MLDETTSIFTELISTLPFYVLAFLAAFIWRRVCVLVKRQDMKIYIARINASPMISKPSMSPVDRLFFNGLWIALAIDISIMVAWYVFRQYQLGT